MRSPCRQSPAFRGAPSQDQRKEALRIMSDESQVPPGNVPRGLNALILPPNLGPRALMEWLETARHFLYVGSVVLGADAAAVNAKLRRAKGMPIVGGLTQTYRANKVSKPIGQASSALVAAVRYLQLSGNQLEAAYLPELEAVKYRPGASGWDWNQ